MNLKTLLLGSGVAAMGVIVLAAAAVLIDSKPMATTTESPRLSADVVAAEQPRPDLRARGVIIARSETYFQALTPQGDRQPLYEPTYPANGVSPDGKWQAGIGCDGDSCFVSLFDLQSPNDAAKQRTIHLRASFAGGEWAPQSSTLAALDEDGGLYVLDAVTGEPILIGDRVTAYAWVAGDSLVFATDDGAASNLVRVSTDGFTTELATLASPVDRFYVSPQHDQLIYTQDSDAGWRLLSLEPQEGAIDDYGNVGGVMGGSDRPVPQTAPQLAVAWSPDGNQIAVGPVSYPYAMHLITPGAEEALRSYFFEEGYAGELSWSPDGSQLAISTYSLDRTQHEVYLKDADSNMLPRHLLDGCKIVWSPDGKYIAVKREPHDSTGIAAIRVDTGYNWPVTTLSGYVPVSWGVDESDAVALAMKPVPYAVQLGK
jgi:WD40 repeat protein